MGLGAQEMAGGAWEKAAHAEAVERGQGSMGGGQRTSSSHVSFVLSSMGAFSAMGPKRFRNLTSRFPIQVRQPLGQHLHSGSELSLRGRVN